MEDIVAAWRWAGFESGHETRDVLENGIRRVHMEARFGRAVTLADIQATLAIPLALRPRLIGRDGTERFDPVLPWNEQPFFQTEVRSLRAGGEPAAALEDGPGVDTKLKLAGAAAVE